MQIGYFIIEWYSICNLMKFHHYCWMLDYMYFNYTFKIQFFCVILIWIIINKMMYIKWVYWSSDEIKYVFYVQHSLYVVINWINVEIKYKFGNKSFKINSILRWTIRFVRFIWINFLLDWSQGLQTHFYLIFYLMTNFNYFLHPCMKS